MRTKILVSLMIAGVAAAAATGSTFALFSDTETSIDNQFTAGAVDLKIDWNQSYNGQDLGDQDAIDNPGPIFQLDDVKPGDEGEATISLHLETNPSWIWFRLNETVNDDVSSTEPELEVDEQENESDQFDGEILQNLEFLIWYDDGDNIYEDERVIFNGTGEQLENVTAHQMTAIDFYGFETPEVDTEQGWDIFSTSEIESEGWQVDWNDDSGDGNDPACENVEPQLEIHESVQRWNAYEGDQYVELDTDCDGPGGSVSGEKASVTLSRVNTVPGKTYSVTYHYSPRPNHNDNEMDVIVDGNVVASHSANGGSNTQWTENTVQFTADDNQTTIAFSETGTPDAMGMFLDAITVEGTGTVKNGILLDGNMTESGTQPFQPGVGYLGFMWSLPEDVGNEVQTDSAQIDMLFYAEQFRNNENPAYPFSN